MRRAAFPLDEALDEPGRRAAAALAPSIRRVDAAWTGPAARARETAVALGLEATVDDRLSDLDAGAWAGRRLEEIAAREPAALAAWLETGAAPPSGESVTELLVRVEGWLGSLRTDRTVAVTHPAVVRAAVVIALRAPAASFWRVEAGPLARLRLRESERGWTVLSLVG